MSEDFDRPQKQNLIANVKSSFKSGCLNQSQFDYIMNSINSSDYEYWDNDRFETLEDKVKELGGNSIVPPREQLKQEARQKLKKSLINGAQYDYILSIVNLENYTDLSGDDFGIINEELELLGEYSDYKTQFHLHFSSKGPHPDLNSSGKIEHQTLPGPEDYNKNIVSPPLKNEKAEALKDIPYIETIDVTNANKTVKPKQNETAKLTVNKKEEQKYIYIQPYMFEINDIINNNPKNSLVAMEKKSRRPKKTKFDLNGQDTLF